MAQDDNGTTNNGNPHAYADPEEDEAFIVDDAAVEVESFEGLGSDDDEPSPAEDEEDDEEGEWVWRKKGALGRTRARVMRGRAWWVSTSAPLDEDLHEDRELPGWAVTGWGRLLLGLTAVVGLIAGIVVLWWWMNR